MCTHVVWSYGHVTDGWWLEKEEEAAVKRFVALGGQRRLETDKRGRQRTFYVKPKSIERIDTLNGVFGYLDYLEYNKKGY